MKQIKILVLAAILLGITTEVSAVPQVEAGGVNGNAFTTSVATVAGVNTILTAPAIGQYVITQFCAYLDAWLYSTSLPYIGTVTGTSYRYGQDACVTFSPGIVVPAGDDILVNTAGVSYVIISGVQTR